MIKMRHIALSLMILFVSTTAFSHALLLSAPRVANDPNFQSPKPRDDIDGHKIGAGSVAPCGSNTISATMPTYTKGQVVKFEWAETIQHPGYFVFQISSDDGKTFSDLAEYIDDQNGSNINRANPNTWHYYPSAAKNNFRVTLPPTLTCNHCIVRFIQHMSDTKATHANNPLHDVDYFSCADIKIADTTPPVVDPPVVDPPVVVQPPTPPFPGDDGVSTLSSKSENKLPEMNSCGFIVSNFKGGGGGSTGLYIAFIMSLFFFPFVLLSSLRLQRVVRKRRR